MGKTSESNKRIAKNTLYLYVRMFITMAIGIYASRIVLRVLGASDYGIYNVVGGVVTMFTMVSAALQTGTQRYLNYAMGENDFEKLKRTFSIAFGIHFFIALGILLIGETIGLWFVYNYLNIPDGRMSATIWVYQFSLITFVVNLIQLPFQSCIIAHERMNMYAFMSIYSAVMKLLVIIFIQYISVDKLILYGALVFTVHLSSVLIYNIYCRRKFPECSFHIIRDKKLAKELALYSGWNLMGGGAVILTNQALNILLNIFNGTVVNAARGLAMAINGYIMAFVNNFQTAASPQIVKLYAAYEYDHFYNLVKNNCRTSVYLYLAVAIPAYLEIEYVLQIWLGEYPSYTDIFVRILLIQYYFNTITQPIGMSVHASGNIKWLNIVNSTFLALCLPFCYIALSMDYDPTCVFWINALFYAISTFIFLYYSHKYTGFPLKMFFMDVLANSLIGACMMGVLPYFVSLYMEVSLARFLIVCFTSVMSSILVIYFWGLTPGMKQMLRNKFIKKSNTL